MKDSAQWLEDVAHGTPSDNDHMRGWKQALADGATAIRTRQVVHDALAELWQYASHPDRSEPVPDGVGMRVLEALAATASADAKPAGTTTAA